MFGSNNPSNNLGSAFGGGANNNSNNNPSQSGAFGFGSSNTNANANTNAFGLNAKPASGFSFGAGSNNQQTQSSASPFGAAKSTGSGFSFGANADANKSQTTSTQPSGFGQLGSNTNNSGGFSFGKKDESPAAAPLGGASSATNAGGLFGASRPAQSTTPQNTTPKLGGFGAPAQAGSSGAFGSAFGQKKDDSQEKKPAFGFGASSTGLNAFGSSQTGSTSLFGAKKDDSPATGNTGGNSFQLSNLQQPKPSLPFGNAGTEAKSQSPFSGAETATPKPTSSPFSLGDKKDESSDKPASGAGFLFGKKDDEKDKPASGSLFGAGGQSSNSTAGGFSFGANKPEQSDKKEGSPFSFGAKKPEESDKKEGSAFSFGPKKDETSSTSGSLFGAKADDSANKPSSGFSFGAKKDEDKDKPAGGFSFGAKKEEGEAKKEVATANVCQPSSSTTASTTDPSQPNLKPTKIQPIPVSIDNKNLDDLILKWSKQLSSTAKLFNAYTDRVKSWDLKLVESGDAITKLHQESLEVQALESKIDQQLQFVENQQDELEKVLDNYELQTDILLNNIELNNNSGVTTSASVPAITGGGANTSTTTAGAGASASASASSSALTTRDDTQHLHQQQQLQQALVPTSVSLTDKLREKAYYNAELLDERLDTLGENLNTLIAEVNSISNIFNKSLAKNLVSPSASNKEGESKAGDKKDQEKIIDNQDNAIEEIIQLLNLHLENLKFIESAETVLKKKLSKST